MKSILSGLVALLIILIIGVMLGHNLDKEVGKVQSKVGQSLIFQKDTLMVIDYSFFNSNYTLEDGKTISWKLVDGLKWVEGD